MQTLFEVGFILALTLPAAAVVAGACAALGASFDLRRFLASPTRAPKIGHGLFVRRAR